MRHLPVSVPLRGIVAGLAVAIAVVITAGSLFLISGDQGRADAAGRSPAAAKRSPAAEPAATLSPDAAPDPALPASRPVIGGPGVPVTPPHLMAITPSTVPDETLRELAKLPHVQKVAVTDGGRVRVAGTALQLLAVDPAQFRSWTAKTVAEHPEVWSALARGEFVADAAAVRRLSLVLGEEYQLDEGPRLRLAASAALGLPGIDGLIGKELGQRLGFPAGVVVLVHGEAGLINRRAVERLLGAGASVVPINPSKPSKSPNSSSDRTPAGALVGRPTTYLELYQRSAELCPGLSWTVLAAIGQVESNHGRNNGPSSAGALGPMQFMPATWKAYGVDGDGDGEADIWSPFDAVPSAAKYLCRYGAGQGGEKLRKAVWFYNHSWAYVDRVLALADAYARTYS